MSARSNNFDAMRLLAAFMVLVCHAAPLSGLPQPPEGIQDCWRTLGTLGVYIFFSMSGYLISKSWESDPDPIRYIVRRSLRIFPGLIAVVFISAFVIGPLFTTKSLSAYFSDAGTYRYLQTALLYPVHFWLPGLFSDNPYPGINGSLWTLPLEFTMYLVLMAIGMAGGTKTNLRLPILLAALAAFAWHGWFGENFQFAYISSKALATNGVYFLEGAILYQLRDMMKFRELPALLLILLVFTLPHEYKKFLLALAVPYTTLSVATASTPYIRSVGRYGDFSYGFYIYAFPVQEAFAHLFPQTHVALFIVATTLITMACSVASWHLVERPMLRLKPGSSSGKRLKILESSGSPAVR